MIVFPNAKINLGLKVKEKRDDGFHNIESLMLPIGLCDILEITESENTIMNLTGIEVEGFIDDNMVMRSYELLKEKFDLPPIGIHLHKAIPSQAGLGGGSADASYMMRLLNKYFNLDLDNEELQHFSLKIGSDCPFFVENLPAYVSGRGDILENINLNLSGFFIVVVKPDVHIPTAESYKNIVRSDTQVEIKEIIKLPIESWKNELQNDFENYAFQKYPVIRSLKNKLYDNGAVYASMSGSGSAVYGVFNEHPGLKKEFGNIFYWEGKL